MTEVVLVGCTKTKRDTAAEARDLYDESALFRKRRKVARARGDWWCILSAEHGLVRPENWVEPYDTFIGNVDSEEWAAKVLDVLFDDLARHDDPTVTILAGSKYVDPLLADLEHEGYEVLDPLRGLRPGERMSRLDDMAEETEQAKLLTDGKGLEANSGREGWELDVAERLVERGVIQVGKRQMVVEDVDPQIGFLDAELRDGVVTYHAEVNYSESLGLSVELAHDEVVIPDE